MPIITNLEDKILQLIRANKYQWFTVGVNLGGVPGEYGGSGIPLGGFTGQLIQSKVTYDTTEAETWDPPSSGISLVDNLNRIRYRIKNVENAPHDAVAIRGIDVVGWPPSVSGQVLVFDGNAYAPGTASGGGGGETDTKQVKVSVNDTTAGYLEDKITAGTNIVISVLNDGGNEDLEIAASGLAAEGHTHTESEITDLSHDAVKIRGDDISGIAPASGQALVFDGTIYAPGTVGGEIEIQEDDTPKVSSATILNFEGGVSVTDEGSGKATILISGGSGGGSPYTYILEDVTSQIPAAGDNFTLAAAPASGSLVVHYNGLTQQPNNYTTTSGGFHTLFSPVSGDELVVEYYTDVPSENILALSLEVQDNDSTVAQNVSILNFEGVVVTDEGNGKVTISGGTGSGNGGNAIDAYDEDVPIASGITSLNFKGNSVTATASGTAVTVTVVTDNPFEGARWHLNANSSHSGTGWNDLHNGNQQSYNKDFDTVDDGTYYYDGYHVFKVPETGYYRFHAQVTVSGNLPSSNSFEVGLFQGYTPWIIYKSGYWTTSGVRTLSIETLQEFTKDQEYAIKTVNGGGGQYYCLSGVANTFIEWQKLQIPVELEFIGARIILTSDPSIPNSTYTYISWDSEKFDTDDFWASSPNPTRIVIPEDGYYHINSMIRWFSNSSGERRLLILKNATTTIAYSRTPTKSGTDFSQSVSTMNYFNADDYIEVTVWQNSGTAVNLDGQGPEGQNTYVEITKIGS